jgi:hypothetical protein
MGCGTSRITPASDGRRRDEGIHGIDFQPNPALQQALRNMQKHASSKNAAIVEQFLKSCFSQINRQEAMRTIIQNDRAKTNYIKFLKEEYFVGMPGRFMVRLIFIYSLEIFC